MLTKLFFKQWLNKLELSNKINLWAPIHNALCNNKFFDDEVLCPNYNKLKGDIFEHLTKYVFISKGYTTYLYTEIPYELKKQLNLPNTDKGIDLIITNNNITYTGIQCKWRSSFSNSILKCYVTEFIHAINTSKLTDGILVTNVSRVTPGFNKIDNLKWYLRENIIKDITYELIQDIINEKEMVKVLPTVIQYELRDYQKEAINILLQDETKAKQVIMACGTGKTVIFSNYLKQVYSKVNKIVIALPSLHLVKQTYKNLINTLGKSINILCICSELDVDNLTCGESDNAMKIYDEYLASDYEKVFTTRKDIIKRRINGKKIIVLTTYHSSELLHGSMFDIGIFDEAHKTVNNNIFGYLLDNKNCEIKNRIFFTATPRYYKGDNGDTISMCNEDIYGKEIFCYPFKKAIENGHILDFKIVLYMAPKGLEELIDEQWITDKKLNIDGKNLIATDFISAIQIYLHVKSCSKVRRILTYHNKVKNASRYTKVLKYVFDKYGIDAKVFVMSGSTKMCDRDMIFNEFNSYNGISIICSAKVLNEGVDIPCVDTVAFVEPRSSTIDVTQCVGRAMRLHDDMKECYVLIPVLYDKVEEEHNYKQVILILTAMNELDDKLVEEFSIRGVNNKIIVRNMDRVVDIKDDGKILYDIEDIEGKLERKVLDSNHFSWDKRLAQVIEYIEEHKKLPNKRDNINNYTKMLGNWIGNQKKYHKKRMYIFKNDIYYIKWSKFIENYSDYFRSNEDIWDETLIKVKEYININNNLPQCRDKNNEIKYLGYWLRTQKTNYNLKSDRMKEEKNREKYEEFINEFKIYFNYKDNDKIWNEMLLTVKNYINTNKVRPSITDNNENIKKMSTWLSTQNQNYKNKNKYMKIKENRIKYKQFMDEYKNYFKSNDDKWQETLNEVKKYIDKNKIKPSINNKNKEIKHLGKWLSHQTQNYKNNTQYLAISENRIIWEQFYSIYKKYIKTYEDIWDDTFNGLIKYIDNNKKLPSYNRKIQSNNDETNNIKYLSKWLSQQKQNYKNENQNMKKKEYRDKWTTFMEKYKDYMKTNDEIWHESFNKVKMYINTNNIKPSRYDKDTHTKSLGLWLMRQNKNYNTNSYNMNIKEYREIWLQFMNEYKKYL